MSITQYPAVVWQYMHQKKHFWIRNWSHITHILFFFLFLLERPRQKKPKAPSFQNGSGWHLTGLFVSVLRRLTESELDLTPHFQGGGHDVISRRKVLPSGECIWSIRQFLIHSTFVLVNVSVTLCCCIRDITLTCVDDLNTSLSYKHPCPNTDRLYTRIITVSAL